MKNKSILFAITLFAATATTPFLFAEDAAAPAAPADSQCEKACADGAKPKQEKMKPMERAQKRLQHLTTALALTPDQQQKIRDILKADFQQAKAEREANAALSPEERKDKKMASMEKSRASIRAVLTPEQQAKFDTMKSTKGKKEQAAPVPAA